MKKAQGEAERMLINQIIPITFFALPVDDLESGDNGRQMARYLGKRKDMDCFVSYWVAQAAVTLFFW